MIVEHEVLDPILQELNPPRPCPMIDRETNYSYFAHGFDTTGGYKETDDHAGVTCRPVHMAKNKEIVHPSCESCHIKDTVIFSMKEYRKKLGLT